MQTEHSAALQQSKVVGAQNSIPRLYQDGSFPFVDVTKPSHRLTFTVYLLLPFFPVHCFLLAVIWKLVRDQLMHRLGAVGM